MGQHAKNRESTTQEGLTSEEPPLILVVDDEKQLANVYADYLKEEYRVKTAYTGQDALASMTEEVSIVLLDRNIPDLSGEQILAEIRENAYDCRVAMVTSVKPDFDILELGFDEYVTKPALKQDLTDTVEVLLARSSYDTKLNEYYSLISKQALLQEAKSEAELSRSKEYNQMKHRITGLRSDLDQMISDFNDKDFIVSFRNISAESPSGGEDE